MKNIKKLYRLGGGLLLTMWLLWLTAPAAFAQQANPTPLPPSGSNPTRVAPTDVPLDWSLFWVLMFFVTLCAGLIFANWLVRRGTFEEPERRL
jgi:hypothetical protein